MSPDSPEDLQPLTPGQKKSQARPKWGTRFEEKVTLIASLITPYDYIYMPFYFLHFGGGLIFLPLFLIFLVLLGVPMLLLEVAVGQFMSRGTWAAWNIAPLFKGVGYLMTIHNGQFVFFILWLLMSQVIFCHDLAVAHPNQLSIYSHCAQIGANGTNANITIAEDEYFGDMEFCEMRTMFSNRWIHPFMYNEAELVNASQLDGGQVLAMLLLTLLVCGIVAAGRRVLGALSAVCAILPPLLMLMLMFRVITLPGASEGLRFGFIPQWRYLLDIETYKYIAIFALFFVRAGEGLTLTAASYNRFHNGFLLDCLLAVFVRIVTMLLTAVTIWGAVGVSAHVLDRSIHSIAQGGLEMIHVVSEVLLLYTPGGGFWTACFLVCVLLGCLSHAVWTVQAVVAAIWDILPQTPRFRHLLRKHALVAVFAIPWLFYGIGYCTKGSWRDALHMVPWVNGPFKTVTLCLLECAAIGWMFGARRFQAAWATMQGRCAFPYPMVFWAVVTPVVLVILLLVHIVWTIMHIPMELIELLVTILFMAISALVLLFTRQGTLWQKWKIMTTPWDLEPHQMQPSYGRYETIAMSAMAG